MSTKSQFSQFEEEMLKVWEQEKTFQQSLEQRKDAEYFSFYDGPPFANGLPHYGHVVPGTIKDAVARYKTMRGYYVPRKGGWDTHGLPVEYDVEKQLKISGKKEILKLGIDKFNQACRDSVFRYKGEFESFIRRMGRWLDLDNAYATLDDNYIESVWWVVSELFKKDLVYEGYRSMPYCPRCATPLSNFELNQGYQDNVKDPSVYALFPLTKDPKTALLAWTTTPWTLPANAALAVDETAEYVTTEVKGQDYQLIVAKKLAETVLKNDEYKVVKTQKGKDLVGLEYQPLYAASAEASAYKVYGSNDVSLEDGTGILHVAPRYGETDLALGQQHQLPLIESVDSSGHMTEVVESAQGLFFKEADPLIIADLTKQGRIFAVDDSFTHTYPFCWRCDTPLMYYATPTWNVAVTKLVKDLVKNNQQINWVPPHIKDGRFGNWLAEARDWGISRNRYWGAPIPVWRCEDGHITVVGSIAELKDKAVDPSLVDDLHRPGIDAIKVKCQNCDKEATRIEEVLDCWFESGSMPYGQDHYPFENEDSFKKGFPAQFISEGLDQTRGWFYTLHVLATALFNQPAYQNVVCHGIVVAGDGKKLSKRLQNYPPLNEVFDNYGADVLRFFMLSSPAMNGEEVRFSADHLKDTQRNVFLTLWNVFSFYKTYTETEQWTPPAGGVQPESNNVLDQWVITRLNQTVAEVSKQADSYKLAAATRPLVEFIDDLSNWYLRRSRRRFWKNEDKKDKESAFKTLHYVLVRLSQLIAPWAPFLSDKIYRELATSDMPKSVHLTDWPKPGETDHDRLLAMNLTRQIVNEGLSQRSSNGIKVRQPLESASVQAFWVAVLKAKGDYLDIVRDELNVKEVKEFGPKPIPNTGGAAPAFKTDDVKLNTEIPHELKLEGLVREVIRHVQQYRKELGLNVSDKIELSIQVEDGELQEAIQAHQDTITDETIASKIALTEKEQTKPVSIDGKKLTLTATKAG